MNETPTITTERVDDIPLLLAQFARMGVAELLEQYFPTHGNWQGLSLGAVACVWLTHILSRADPRLNQVQDWAERRLHTLSMCLQQPVRALDLADDRLASLLDALSNDDAWAEFECALNRGLLRVYDLRPERVRLDTTSASGYWQVSPNGLFQFGHSKDHRPDLPQLKVMLAALDPLGLPLAIDVLRGQQADDPAYWPAIKRVQHSLGLHGLLYIGDCKMAALFTRAGLAWLGERYLCPCSARQFPASELAAWLAACEAGDQTPLAVVRQGADGTNELIAEGYERAVQLAAEVEGQRVQWTERQLLVRSWAATAAAEAGLHARLRQAETELAQLTKRRQGKQLPASLSELEHAAASVLKRHRVEGLLRVNCQEEVQLRQVRSYKGAPTREVAERQLTLSAALDEQAVRAVVGLLGWRVYVTNAPAEELSLEAAVLAYREEYLVERNFGRLKGQPLSLTPMYLERDEHATGLVRLVSLGLRGLSLLEYVVRQRLAEQGQGVAGLYAGNPRRATVRPTAESLLGSFKEISLTVIGQGDWAQRHITPLSPLQLRVLQLLDVSPTIYLRLSLHLSEPP